MKLKEMIMFIGLGNAGSKIALEFQKLGYKAMMANGSVQDIKVLQGATNVYQLNGYDGFGGDRSKAMDCLSENMEFVNALNNIKESIVFVLNSTGGSTGSSLGTIVPELLLDNVDEEGNPIKTVCCVEVLPATNEALTKHKNTFSCIKELEAIEGLGSCVFIDNNSDKDLKQINTTFVSLLDTFITDDSWSDKNNFDTSERINMLKESGAMIISRLGSDKVEDKLIQSLTKSNIFAPIQHDKVVGQIGIINSTVKGVAVDSIVAEFGKPTNVYEGWNGKNTLTVLSGLSYPIDHIVKLGEIAKQEQEERIRNKNTATKKLVDIAFLDEEETVKQPKAITNKKTSKMELLRQLKEMKCH